jgi:hypothetical protein
VNINYPIYGEANPTFTDFVAPGMLVTIIFAQSIGLTALGLVIERREGLPHLYSFQPFFYIIFWNAEF